MMIRLADLRLLTGDHLHTVKRCISKSIFLFRLSEAVNESYCYESHARSGFRFIIRHQEDAWIVPIRALGWATDPVLRGILMRVEFLGTDNSWPWASMKKMFGVAQLEDARSYASSYLPYRVDRNLVLYQARGGTQEAISSCFSLPK
jgi:hypothetical protein